MSNTFDYYALKRSLDVALRPLEALQVPPKRVQILEDRESVVGGYGDVVYATLVGDPRIMAVKQLRPTGGGTDRIRMAVRLVREVQVWSKLEHPNILSLIGFHLDANHHFAWLISPYELNGNIFQFLSHAKPDIVVRLRLVADTTRGLKYLHELDPCVIHGDIKSANVLVNQNVRAVLCDFGLSRLIQVDPSGLTTSRTIKGSTRYLSPELLEENAEYSREADIWAWGCLSFEILTDQVPYAGARIEHQVLLKIARGTKPAKAQSYIYDESLQGLLDRSWDANPSLRPTVQECLSVVQRSDCVDGLRHARLIGAMIPFDSALLSGLHHLELQNILADASPSSIVKVLAAAPGLSSLILRDVGGTDDPLTMVASPVSMLHLTDLQLSKLTAEYCSTLVQSIVFPKVSTLHLACDAPQSDYISEMIYEKPDVPTTTAFIHDTLDPIIEPLRNILRSCSNDDQGTLSLHIKLPPRRIGGSVSDIIQLHARTPGGCAVELDLSRVDCMEVFNWISSMFASELKVAPISISLTDCDYITNPNFRNRLARMTNVEKISISGSLTMDPSKFFLLLQEPCVDPITKSWHWRLPNLRHLSLQFDNTDNWLGLLPMIESRYGRAYRTEGDSGETRLPRPFEKLELKSNDSMLKQKLQAIMHVPNLAVPLSEIVVFSTPKHASLGRRGWPVTYIPTPPYPYLP